MITERTLKRWRRSALVARDVPTEYLKSPNEKAIYDLAEIIIKLTQELLDQHLLRKE